MPAPPEVPELVDRFRTQYDSYRQPSYNETQLRREFVDPLFKALGWDVDNTQGYAEAYKDVVHEDALKIGQAHKAPDYSFRIGGVRKFFVETKKPSVNLKDDPDPAYQLRRYAWSAKLPLSILTDFEELAVYDCRLRPTLNDKPSLGRILYLTWEEYFDRWDELADIFSRDAILKGAFDRYAESKKKRGTAEVDDEFLREIEQWRADLAKNIARRNSLSQRELNTAVQKTIDRIIFLRICEDRGIEDYGQLRGLLNGPTTYQRLGELFQNADDRYNSGLFHFHKERGRVADPDEWTLGLAIDDKVLKGIIKRLYYPDSPYEFSVIGADILGQVYEQFLGKVIRLTSPTRAVVEEKPEVRKAGGVYYTPTYIVDYIVENTVGKLIEKRKPHEVAGRTAKFNPKKGARPLKVLDPACGSGSFLIGAYQFLLDWYRDRYVDDGPGKHKDRVYEYRQGEYRLTTEERKRILLDHIYGVDLDPQAVEVTKLSLLLKVLEGESQERINQQLLKLRLRALPDLADNIKCGNSLIGPDYYGGKQLELFDEEELLRVNAFDWEEEFEGIMSTGGFDAVIGNPPYIFGEYHDQATKEFLQSCYSVATNQYDTYWIFTEASAKLTAPSGRFALIVPDALLARDEAAELRELLLKDGVESLYHCGLVFLAGVSACVFVAAPGTRPARIRGAKREDETAVLQHSCSRKRFEVDPLRRFLIHATDEEWAALLKMESSGVFLGDRDVCRLSRGEEIGKKHVLDRGPCPILVGEDIGRYSLTAPSRFVAAPRKKPETYSSPKIVIVKTGVHCIAARENSSTVTMQSVYNLHVDTDWVSIDELLGILNSRLCRFFISKTFTAYKLLFPQMNQTTLKRLPLPPPSVLETSKLGDRVNAMCEMCERLSHRRSGHSATALQRQIAATDREIDQLVYQLYGLSGDEIRIVEQATAR